MQVFVEGKLKVELTERGVARVRNSVLGAGVATTLMLWVSLADPVNIPKMLILSLFAAWILGRLIVSSVTKPRHNFTLGQLAILLFILGILIAAFASDERYTAFYGAPGRGNGAISYLALSVLCFAAMISFDAKGISRLKDVLVAVGAFLTFYGLLQTTHGDPIKWNLLYSPIVGTLGNPDFVSAALGVCAIATLWWILVDQRVSICVIGGALVALEIFTIRKSGSMQGLLVVALGFSMLTVVKLWNWKRKAGYLGLGVTLLGSVPVLLGLFNKGPFAAHIYRGSIQSRIDYWHAAISMFKAHPFLGVGLDRMGDSYWQYAPQVQVVANQGTDNAHNVFLQLLATGGLVVFLPYLVLIGVISVAAVRAAIATSGKLQFEVIALSAIWISLLLVSTISIDTLGVAVWFWISGGALYSLASKCLKKSPVVPKATAKLRKQVKRSPAERKSYLAPLVSSFLVAAVFMLVFPAWRSSLAIMDLQRNRSGLDKTKYIAKAIDISNLWPKNPQTLISLADLALRVSDPVTAEMLAKEAVQKDPRSYNAHLLSALAYETELKYGQAIPFRVTLLRLNPWGIDNMMQLLKDYIQIHDIEKARAISTRISQVRPDSDAAKAAALLVKG